MSCHNLILFDNAVSCLLFASLGKMYYFYCGEFQEVYLDVSKSFSPRIVYLVLKKDIISCLVFVFILSRNLWLLVKWCILFPPEKKPLAEQRDIVVCLSLYLTQNNVWVWHRWDGSMHSSFWEMLPDEQGGDQWALFSKHRT